MRPVIFTSSAVASALFILSTFLYRRGNCAPPDSGNSQSEANLAQKRYDVPAYSIEFPNGHMPKLTNWIKEGSTRIDSLGIELIDEETGARGSLWNTVPLTTNTFDIEFEVEIKGPGEAKTGDGFAVWLVSEPDYASFLSAPSGELWNCFGYKPNFSGYVVMFASSDRNNNPTSSISGLWNNGSKMIDTVKDVPSAEGIYYTYRNSHQPLAVRIQYTPDQVKCSLRWANEKDWRSVFASSLPSGSTLPRGFLGFTASNDRVPKGEEGNIVGLAGLQGDKTIIHNIKAYTTDYDAANKHGTSAQEMFAKLMNAPSKDPTSHIKMLAEIIDKHVIPKQEHIMSEIIRMQNDNRHLSERMDLIQGGMAGVGHDRQFREGFDNLKMLLSENSKASMSMIDELKGGLNVDDLSRRSAQLEEVLKSHTSRNQWLTLGLGSLLVVFCGLFYKRMRDMEKKHIL